MIWMHQVDAAMAEMAARGMTIAQIVRRLSSEFRVDLTPAAVEKRLEKTGRPVVTAPLTGTASRGVYSKSFWGKNPEAVGIVDSLAREGKSAREIVDAIFAVYSVVVTRNAVIGKMHRMSASYGANLERLKLRRAERRRGKKSGEPPPKLPRPARLEPRKSARARQSPQPILLVEPPREARYLTLIDLPSSLACRWIVEGEPSDAESIRYCGAIAERGQAYCPHHRVAGTRPRAAPSSTPVARRIR